jgi:hypothetical protein
MDFGRGDQVTVDAEITSEQLRSNVYAFLTEDHQNRLALIDAAPGSGKSYSLLQIAKKLVNSRPSVKVAIVTQTNNQANDLAISALTDDKHGFEPGAVFRFVSDRISKPDNFVGQWATQPKGISRAFESIIIGTSSKWISLVSNANNQQKFDYVLIDECYQMTWSIFLQMLNLGSKFALIGDKGQIPPVVTVDGSRWAHLDIAPNLPAPVVLRNKLRNSASFQAFDLKHCRRLPAESIEYIAPFYADLQSPKLVSNVLPVAAPQDRGLKFEPNSSMASYVQEAIQLSSTGEPVLVTLGDKATGDPVESDRELAQVIRDLTQALLGQEYFQKDDSKNKEGLLQLTDIAICSTKRAMNALIEDELQSVLSPHLAEANAHSDGQALANGGLLVDTPERLQGLQRKVMIAVHPLSNSLNPSDFDLDTGRLCVMASRHQVALILVSRAHVRKTLSQILPNASQAPGQPDSVGKGHMLHRGFIEKLYETRDKNKKSRVVSI